MARILGIDRSKYEPGDVLPIGAASAGLFTLLCDGSSVSQAAYPRLYAKIGATYGAASAGQFLLPDCRSRSIMGSGTGSGLSARTLGTSLGTETETVPSIPAHTHTGTTSTIGNHSHNMPAGPNTVGVATNPSLFPPWYTNQDLSHADSGHGLNTPPVPTQDDPWATHTHPFALGSDGSNTGHNNIHPALVIGFCIVYW